MPSEGTWRLGCQVWPWSVRLGWGYYEQYQVAQGFATLAALHVDVSGGPQQGYWLSFPAKAPQSLLSEALTAVPDRNVVRQLNLSSTQVSDLKPLAGLAQLQSLDLSSTQVSDLSPLAALTNFEVVALAKTSVSDEAIAALRRQLAPPRGKLRAIGKQSLDELLRQLRAGPAQLQDAPGRQEAPAPAP